MREPNVKLDDDMSVYEDNHVLKQVCRKGSEFLDTVNCKALWEIKGLDVLARWICIGFNGSGGHVDWWATPREVISAELRGESGCRHCRALEEEDVVSKKELLAAVKVQDKRIEKSERRGKKFANRLNSRYIAPNDRYTL